MKYQINYSRKIQTLPYESLSVTYSMEFHEDEIDVDRAYEVCRDSVNERLDTELTRMGIRRVIL